MCVHLCNCNFDVLICVQLCNHYLDTIMFQNQLNIIIYGTLKGDISDGKHISREFKLERQTGNFILDGALKSLFATQVTICNKKLE